MNEHQFVKSVHATLKRHPIYIWKISANYHNGIPDTYYSSTARDMWVEYKSVQSGLDIGIDPLQIRWLRDRHKEGRTCWLAVLTPEGVVTVTSPPYPRKLPANYRELAVPLKDFKSGLVAYLQPREEHQG
jgi:hypothetical protein